MKKYKFKLDALLKIRKIREDQCKMEIGRIQVQISSLKNEIAKHNHGIQEAYDLQEKSLQNGATGRESRFHPYFVQGKRSHIEEIQGQIDELENRVERMYMILNRFRADVKVIEEMKEKDKVQHKKHQEKKMHEEIEEQVQNWRQVLK